jgi:hypothetical protein
VDLGDFDLAVGNVHRPKDLSPLFLAFNGPDVGQDHPEKERIVFLCLDEVALIVVGKLDIAIGIQLGGNVLFLQEFEVLLLKVLLGLGVGIQGSAHQQKQEYTRDQVSVFHRG